VNTFDDGDEAARTAATPRERVMGFWDHLDELRGTIIKSVVVFVIFAGLIGYYLTEFSRLLMWPFHSVVREYPGLTIELGTNSMMEGFNVIVQICLLGGLMLSAPFVLFFIGQFVAPALTPREVKAVLPMCVSAFFLFLAGAAFGFLILAPSALRVMIEINTSMDWVPRWNVDSYYTILTRLVLGVGATFQFPLVLVLLVWIGLVSTAGLRKFRRHSAVAIFVLAAVVTPSTEPVGMMLLAAPLLVLYELAILVAARVERRRERSGAAVMLALLALLPHRAARRDAASGQLAGL